MHRRDADVERVVADNVGALVVDEAEAAQVGDVADVGGAVAQDVEDVANGVTGGQWQADPDFVAGRFAVARRVVAAYVFDVVKQRFVGIKQADLPHDKARQRVAADGAEDFATGGVVADEGEAARVVPGSAQAAQQPVGDEAAHDAQGKGGAKPDAEPEAGAARAGRRARSGKRRSRSRRRRPSARRVRSSIGSVPTARWGSRSTPRR